MSQLDSHESIVVAIPGQAAEEFALNGVPDNAIQIIDDEPQGVPTEEEVDAMLAATAGAMLTSGHHGRSRVATMNADAGRVRSAIE